MIDLSKNLFWLFFFFFFLLLWFFWPGVHVIPQDFKKLGITLFLWWLVRSGLFLSRWRESAKERDKIESLDGHWEALKEKCCVLFVSSDCWILLLLLLIIIIIIIIIIIFIIIIVIVVTIIFINIINIVIIIIIIIIINIIIIVII